MLTLLKLAWGLNVYPENIELGKVGIRGNTGLEVMLTMTVQELEQQLLRLSPADKLRVIQLLAQSLNTFWNNDQNNNQAGSPTKLSEFFRQSPLAEAAATGELDLSRDRSLPSDRFNP
jgi:hypothetical protein